MLLNEVFYAHQGCIYLIKNTMKTATLWITINNAFCFNKFKKNYKYIQILGWQRWIFSSYYSSFQCHIFQKTFQYADLVLKNNSLLLSILKTIVCVCVCVCARVRACMHFHATDKCKVQKNIIYLKYKYFLSLFINLMCLCWIKVLISLKKNESHWP